MTGQFNTLSLRQSIALELREAGIKPTPQRVAVYEVLKGTTMHPKVEMIYEALQDEFPTLSLNTVYTALQSLVDAGLVRKLAMRENVCRYDGNAAPHAHFVCMKCGRVEDLGEIVDKELEKITPVLAKHIHGPITDTEHRFYGYCRTCQDDS